MKRKKILKKKRSYPDVSQMIIQGSPMIIPNQTSNVYFPLNTCQLFFDKRSRDIFSQYLVKFLTIVEGIIFS